VAAKLEAQLLIVLVLDPVQHALDHACGVEVKECAGGFQQHLAAEEFFDPVAGIIMEPGPWQIIQAEQAQGLLELA
jgi:hypothetical protein